MSFFTKIQQFYVRRNDRAIQVPIIANEGIASIRKPANNNILFSFTGNQLTIVAIDHAFTFDSLSYSDLNTEYIVNTWNDNTLETDLAKDILAILKPIRNRQSAMADAFVTPACRKAGFLQSHLESFIVT